MRLLGKLEGVGGWGFGVGFGVRIRVGVRMLQTNGVLFAFG